MTYIVVVNTNDEAVSCFTFENINDAKAKYYSELAYRHETRMFTSAAILDAQTLDVIMRDLYATEDYWRVHEEGLNGSPEPEEPTESPMPEEIEE